MLDRAQQGGRYLQYNYNGNGQLTSVNDQTGRTTAFIYDGTGNLMTVASPAQTKQYSYQNGTPLLTAVTDGTNRTLKQISYDSEGRAEEVRDGQNNVLVSISYDNATQRTVTQQGVAVQHTYDGRNTLISTTQLCQDGTAGCGASHSTGYDGNFKANGTSDPNGNPAILNWNAGGSNLESVTNALQQTTEFEYDGYNNLIQITNADEIPTIHAYDHPHLPTFRTSTTNGTNQTTTYVPTYNTTQNGVLVPNGLLLSQTDPSGLVTAYEYNEYGQVTKVTQAGQVTTYWYDALGRVSAVAQTGGSESHTTLNIYDSASRLRGTVQNWDGTTPGATLLTTCTTLPATRTSNVCTFYEYDAAGRTTKVIDARGRSNLTFYDAAGRTYLTVQNYNGANYTNPLNLCNWTNPHSTNNLCQRTEYDSFGRVIKTTDPLGRITRTEYDSLGRVKGTIQNSVHKTQLSQCLIQASSDGTDRDLCTLYTYDPAGNLLITQDPVGRLTRTFYDELNRVVGQVQNWTTNGPIQTFADLQSSCFGLPTNRTSNICTATTYDNVGNAIIHTDPMGRLTRTFYDEVGRVQTVVQNWQTGFDPANCVYDPNNMATANICTSYGYDAFGRQITTTNALDQTSLTVYDSQSRPFLSVANWDGLTLITNESHCSFAAGPRDGNVCTVTYYDDLGRRAATKNGLGQITEYGYDALGRQTSTTRYLNGTPITTSTQLDVLGNRLSSTDARNHTTTYTYDTLNRLLGTTSPMGVMQSQRYNAAGWVMMSSNDPEQELYTEYQYDLFGRLTTTTNPLNQATQFAYDQLGNQTSQTDALNIVTRYQYDALNRLVGVKENDTGGAPTHQSNVLTQYSYDILGNRTGVANAHAKFSEVAYDVLGRPTTISNALGQQTSYTYDTLGRVLEMTDGNNATTTYSYDGLNRLTSTTYAQDNETVSHTYDALGNRLTLSDNTGVTTYTYDSLNRLTSIAKNGGTTTYGYDHNGNRTSLLYPDGKSVTYTYDADNRLTHVLGWVGQQASYTYDKLGRLRTTTLPNGVVTTHSYDDANRLTQMTHQGGEKGGVSISYTYTLNPVGNRTQVVEAQSQGMVADLTSIHYTYDPLHRLTQASYGGILPEYQYTYDALGNVTQSVANGATTNRTYNAANQLLTAQTDQGTVWHYTYDGNGNQIGKLPNNQAINGAVRYTYNQASQLVELAQHNGVSYQVQATAEYDPFSQRQQLNLFSAGQTATTTYTNDDLWQGSVLMVEDELTNTTTHLLHGLGEYRNGEWQYYLMDGWGSVRLMVNQQGEVTLNQSFDPWGGTRTRTGTAEPLMGWMGAQAEQLGLLYWGGRYYDTGNGRFLTPDNHFNPYQPGRGLNPYLIALLLNPIGLVLPFVLRRKKGSAQWFILLFMGMSVTLMVSCDEAPPPPTQTQAPPSPVGNTPPPTNTSEPPTQPPTQPAPPPTPTGIPTSTPRPTDTPIPTPYVFNPPPKANQYDWLGLLGANGCGIIAAATGFTTPGTGEYEQLINKLLTEAGDDYGSNTGIQPEPYAEALKRVFGENNVTARNGWTIQEIANELLKGHIAIVDILVGKTSEHPEPPYPVPNELTIAHFARVLYVDFGQEKVYLENTLANYAQSYWEVSFRRFNEVWEYPEARATSGPPLDIRDPNANKWAAIIQANALR